MSHFRRNVLTLASGAVFVQAIPVLTMPILTRLYQPQDFAVLASYTALVSLLSATVTGRYEMAIMHSSDEIEALQSTLLSVTCSLIISPIIGLICFLLGGKISSLMGQPLLASWMPWLTLPLTINGLIQSFTLFLNWQKKYKDISYGRVSQNIAQGSVAIGLGATFRWGGGLVLGQIVGFAVSCTYFWKKSAFHFRSFSRTKLLDLATRYLSYPLYSAPAALLDVASSSACIFILGRFYPKEVLGQFALTHRLLLVPMVLVGTSVGQAFFQHAAEKYREHQPLYALMVSTSKKLLVYSLPAFLLLILLAPKVFAFIFGPTWEEAGNFARLTALAYWLRLAVSPISSVFMITHRVKLGSFWQLCYFCSSFLTLGLAGFFHLSIQMFFIVYSMHEIVMYTYYFLLARKVCLETQVKV